MSEARDNLLNVLHKIMPQGEAAELVEALGQFIAVTSGRYREQPAPVPAPAPADDASAQREAMAEGMAAIAEAAPEEAAETEAQYPQVSHSPKRRKK
jgi:hypothetical protein